MVRPATARARAVPRDAYLLLYAGEPRHPAASHEPAEKYRRVRGFLRAHDAALCARCARDRALRRRSEGRLACGAARSNYSNGSRPALVVVAAHPDDESIGAGGRLARLAAARFICVTDGAPRGGVDAAEAGCASREEYARVRRAELATALALAGVAPPNLYQIKVVDQEASANLVALVHIL